MTKGRHGGVWRLAHTLFNEGVIRDVTDEQLLERFVTAHREAGEMAFEALVERHGPMVLRICSTILRDQHDAEDAFQATFLVLARQAASIRSRTSVASWLHGVARRVACCTRSAASRRRQHERKAASLTEHFVAEPRWDDLGEVLQEEIDRLPERYRAPIVLCDIEGLTEGQAARRLGRPVGTIRSQLTRGRKHLRCQLIRRGLAPASVVLVIARNGCSANAAVASALVSSTVQSAIQFAVVRATTAGMVSTSAAALAEKFLWRMLMTRVKNTAIVALVAVGIATVGAFAIELQGQKVGAFAIEPQGDKSPSASDAKQELLDLMHAWGKALVQSDVRTMDRLLAYETVCTDTGGGVWDKSQYLEFVRVDRWHIESYELKDTKVQVYGDAAVVTGLLVTNTNSKRQPHVVESYTRTWIRRHGTWQCVAWQTMVIEAGEQGSAAPHPASRRNRDFGPKGRQELSPTAPRR